jgi:hypothetical protein
MAELTEKEKQEALTVAKRCDVWDTAAADALEMFLIEGHDYSAAKLEKWLDGQRERRGYLFVSRAAVDREALAFGQQNKTERSKLFAELGERAFREREAAWGLKRDDFKTLGTPPNAETDDKGQPKKPDPSNPWSAAGWSITAQGRIFKANETLARNLAKAAGVPVTGATKPKAA